MKKTKEEMSEKQKEIAVRHATTNIVRAMILIKRADNALTFAMRSLEGTEIPFMAVDIREVKRIITDALKVLEKYVKE